MNFQQRKAELEKEIEKKVGNYKSINAKCDVLDYNGKPCGEPVTPMIAFSSSAQLGKEWKYQPSYHTGFSCKKHGCVPISLNRKSFFGTKPEDVLGEFIQVKEAELKGLQEGYALAQQRFLEIIKQQVRYSAMGKDVVQSTKNGDWIDRQDLIAEIAEISKSQEKKK